MKKSGGRRERVRDRESESDRERATISERKSEKSGKRARVYFIIIIVIC